MLFTITKLVPWGAVYPSDYSEGTDHTNQGAPNA